MLNRLTSAVVGLLAFAGCILVGLIADNPVSTIVLRALAGLFGGMVVGYIAGALAQVVINEHFRIMVAADIDAELAAAANTEAENMQEKPASEAPEAGFATDTTDKTDTEGGFEPRADAVEQTTFSARAANELLAERQ